MFIGILRERFGTPTGYYESGFREEYERAAERRRADGSRPHVALYFRAVPSERSTDAGPQLTAVLNFRQQIVDDKTALFRVFADRRDLEDHLLQLFVEVLFEAAREPLQSAEGAASTQTVTAAEAVDNSEFDSAEMDEARKQIAAVSDALTNGARGVSTEGTIDFDRLLLIALAFGDDPATIPPHLANRLYRRRADVALSVAEGRLWLRSVAADVGASSRQDRVIPGWALLPIGDDYLVDLFADSDDLVVVGLLRILERLAARPGYLWKVDLGPEVAGRWTGLLARTGVVGPAVQYLAALAGADDAPLVDAIAEASGNDSLLELRSLRAGDPGLMIRSVADASSPAAWKVTAVLNAIAKADTDSLRVAVTKTRAPGELRAAAFRELEARSLVDIEILKVVIADQSLMDLAFASAADTSSAVTLAMVSSSAAELAPAVRSGQGLDERLKAATSSTEDLITALDGGGYVVDHWIALGWKQDAHLLERARQMFDTDAEDLVAPLANLPGWTPKLMTFVRGQGRHSALRILAGNGPVATEDRIRFRAELGRDGGYWRGEAAVLLAKVATADDVPDLLAHIGNVHGADRERVVEGILRAGGTEAARQLINVGEAAEAVRAVSVMGADPGVEDGDFRALLYSPSADVRIAALDELAKLVPPTALEELLDDYPKHGETYFYNVVVELDWLVHAH